MCRENTMTRGAEGCDRCHLCTVEKSGPNDKGPVQLEVGLAGVGGDYRDASKRAVRRSHHQKRRVRRWTVERAQGPPERHHRWMPTYTKEGYTKVATQKASPGNTEVQPFWRRAYDLVRDAAQAPRPVGYCGNGLFEGRFFDSKRKRPGLNPATGRIVEQPSPENCSPPAYDLILTTKMAPTGHTASAVRIIACVTAVTAITARVGAFSLL
jgi:hypothetical protein